MSAKKVIAHLKNWFKKDQPVECRVIPREAHALSREHISSAALKVLYRLHQSDYSAYLVGGGVRDLLLGVPSKDFDVVTDATPEQVKALFKNSRIIGRRFKIVHVVFKDEIIEVSTFRAQKQFSKGRSKRIKYENTYGSLEEDVWRRDFTINSLYYNISDFSILDYTDGLADLQRGVIRMIGDPVKRFKEDPVRLLRAIRFKAKLGFQLEPKLEMEVRRMRDSLINVPASRLLHEFEKLFFTGYARDVFHALDEYGYLALLMPEVSIALDSSKTGAVKDLLERSLVNTDTRHRDGRPLNPAFLFSVMLWPVLMEKLLEQQELHSRFYNALHAAIQMTLNSQQEVISIPKRYISMIRAIWVLQFGLVKRRPKRILSFRRHRYFRAAMDLLELRTSAGEDLEAIATWWRELETLNEADAKEFVQDYVSSRRR